MNRLEGKVALVTGAGRGIGKAIALAYAGEGAFVVCTARTASEVNCVVDRIVAQGGAARAVTADVTEPDEVRRLFEVGLEGKACLDILVANAGRGAGTDKATVAESDPGVWRDLLHVNLLGALPLRTRGDSASAEGGSSEDHHEGSGSRFRTPPRLSAYSAAKAGPVGADPNPGIGAEAVPHRGQRDHSRPVLKEHMLTPEKLTEIEEREAIELPNGEWHKVPADLGELALFLATQPRLGPTGQSYSLLRS